MLLARKRQVAAAAVGLPGPVDGLAAERLDEAVHARGVFGIVELDGLGRPRQKAAVVACDLEAFERRY